MPGRLSVFNLILSWIDMRRVVLATTNRESRLPAGLVDSLLRSGLRVRWVNTWNPDAMEVRKTIHDHATCWLALGFAARLEGGSFAVDLARGHAALVPAGTKMRITAEPAHAGNLAFGFVIEPLAGIDPLLRLNLPQSVAMDDPEVWRRRFATLPLPISSGNRQGRLAARPVCDAFLQAHLDAGFAQHVYQWAETPISDWLRRAHDLLRSERLSHQVRLADLARSCGVSPTHLARAFAAAFGCTPVAFRRRVRLDHAARLLRSDPTAPLREVALCCGFTSLTAFIRAFTAQYGLPPRRFARITAGDHHRSDDPSTVP